MRRRDFIGALGGAAVAGAWPRAAFPQAGAKRPLVAMLSLAPYATSDRYYASFRRGMQRLGYAESQDFDFTVRSAENDLTRLPTVAEEVVALKPDIILTGNTGSALAMRKVTGTIPIICTGLTDPIEAGLVTSFARPGGNVTGFVVTLESLPGKQLELARELVPGASRIGILVRTDYAPITLMRHNAVGPATALGVKLVEAQYRVASDFEAAIQMLARERVDIMVVFPDALAYGARRQIAELAVALRLPSMYAFREHVEDGGLVSYGFDVLANFDRAADFVDKILKGSKPADIPVELPTKLSLVINLKTAKMLNLTISPAMLLRADEVIE